MLISRKNSEKVVKDWAVFVGVCRYDPVMSMVKKGLFSYPLEQVLRESLEQLRIFAKVCHLLNKWTTLIVNGVARECFLVIFVCEVVDDLEALADAKDGPVDAMIILLLLHVLPYAFGSSIEKRLLTSLHVDEWSCSTGKEHTIDGTK